MKENLRDLRLQSGKSVNEVANALHITKSAVTNYEIGIRRISIEQVLILAELYDCTEREVIEAQINSFPNDR